MRSPLKIAALLSCTLICGVLLTNQFAPQTSALNYSLPVVVANAGPDLTVYAGEPLRLDGTNSAGYSRESLADGTWSTRWTTGDGYDVENLVKAPHVYMQPGTYTAQLTIRDASGVAFSDTATVQVLPITASASQTLVDTGNPETNKMNLQAALNQAALNPASNEILVPAGFVANDPIILPARNRSVGTYVTVRVANLSGLPPNRRVTDSDRAKLFKINARPAGVSGYNQAIVIPTNANYYRFIGMEINRTGAIDSYKNDIIAVELDATETRPSHLIFDRILIDAKANQTVRAFAPNSEFTSLLNSSILNVRTNYVETKAIGQWSGNGPLAVVNNRLEAASINFLVGGAPANYPSEVLDGLVFRGNYSWKNPQWVGPNGESIGSGIKNLWELKCGHNVVAAGNIFENNYADAQAGEAILIKSTGDHPWSEVRNLDFRNNKILNTRAGFNAVGIQSSSPKGNPPYLNHVRFVNNLWLQREGRGNLLLSPNYFELIHNTFVSTGVMNNFLAAERTVPEGSGGVYLAPGLKILNNLSHTTYYGSIHSSEGAGTAALNYAFSSWDARANVFTGSPANLYPNGNYFPSDYPSIFANYQMGDYSLASNSIYRGAGTDGNDIGADMTLLHAETNSARSGVWSGGSAQAPAYATVSGRAVNEAGYGLRNVLVVATDVNTGQSRIAQTGSLGYFSFAELETGRSYILTAIHKRYVILDPTRSFTLNSSIEGIVFVGSSPQTP